VVARLESLTPDDAQWLVRRGHASPDGDALAGRKPRAEPVWDTG